jgi:hypothetical protein
MYPVSPEYHEKITADARRVLGKVDITYEFERRELPYDDPSLTYTGTWTFDQEEGTRPVYYATEEGASVKFTFHGTRVSLKSLSWMQDRGVAQCYIDGEPTERLDFGFGGNLSSTISEMHSEKLTRGWHTALETEQFSEERRIQQFEILKKAQDRVITIQYWHDFMNCIRMAGFRSAKMISSQNNLLFSYILFYWEGRNTVYA